MMTVCGRGHEIHGSQDRIPNGTCKACHRENQTRYAKRRKAGVSLLHAVEGRGMSVSEAIQLIRNVGYWDLQKYQRPDVDEVPA